MVALEISGKGREDKQTRQEWAEGNKKSRSVKPYGGGKDVQESKTLSTILEQDNDDVCTRKASKVTTAMGSVQPSSGEPR